MAKKNKPLSPVDAGWFHMDGRTNLAMVTGVTLTREPLDCDFCGNCVGVCPTGALMFTPEHELRAKSAWDEAKQTVTDTICSYCGVGCTLTLRVQDNKIVRVTSPSDSSVTGGHLCVKGRFGWSFVEGDGSGEG